MRKSPDPEHLVRGDGRAVEPRKGKKGAPADLPETEPTATSPGARPCEMMLSAPDELERRSCGEPSVGGGTLYRYCKRHLLQVERAGGVVYRDGWA